MIACIANHPREFLSQCSASHPPRTGVTLGGHVLQRRLTESAIRRLEVAKVPLGLYFFYINMSVSFIMYEVQPARPAHQNIARFLARNCSGAPLPGCEVGLVVRFGPVSATIKVFTAASVATAATEALAITSAQAAMAATGATAATAGAAVMAATAFTPPRSPRPPRQP